MSTSKIEDKNWMPAIRVGDTLYWVDVDKIIEGKVSMLCQKSDQSWNFRLTYFNPVYNSNCTHNFKYDRDFNHKVFTSKEKATKLLLNSKTKKEVTVE